MRRPPLWPTKIPPSLFRRPQPKPGSRLLLLLLPLMLVRVLAKQWQDVELVKQHGCGAHIPGEWPKIQDQIPALALYSQVH